MINNKFKIIFEYMDKEKDTQSHIINMHDDLLKSKEIRELTDIIEDMKSAQNQIFYTGT